METMKDLYRVIIVDDYREMRTAFKANLEALDGPIQVVDVPSGEEALLEAASGEVDLLIADIGLPGLSGLELFERLQEQIPDLKVILVTGQEDEDIRREIADCGADAFFIKPINIPDFLGAVHRILGLTGRPPGEDTLPVLEHIPLHPDITERIVDLRGEVGALSVTVLNRAGVIAAQDGNMPDAVYESKVMPRLLDTFDTVNEISGFLGIENPDSSWYFSGIKYDLFWAHINPEYGMLVITNPIMQNTDLTWVITTVDIAANDTLKIIRELPEDQKMAPGQPPGRGSPSTQDLPEEPLPEKDTGKEEVQSSEAPPPDPPAEPASEAAEEEQALEALPMTEFAQKFNDVVGKDINEYWEEAALENEVTVLEDLEGLSYEEAVKLGYLQDDD
jgi:DNA-binding response OmpR family regulator